MEGKLKQRFFEPLVLLNALSHAQESGQAQGDRVLEDPSPFTDDLAGRDAPQIRRDVLCQLCRICDYRKGEYTTIAMALEDRPSGPVYWISLDSRCQEKVIPFLRGVLTDIHRTCNQKPTLAAQQRLQMELEERFTTFAANRLHKTRKLLRKQLKGAMVAIEQASLNENDLMYLYDWLAELDELMESTANLREQCMVSYDKVRSPEISRVLAILSNSAEAVGVDLKHYLGRMASTKRASRILVAAGKRQPMLFENYEIQIVTCGQVQGPPKDRVNLSLDGIAQRMLPANSPDLLRLKEALHRLDRTAGLMDLIHDQYRHPNFVLRVHAELALLEAVYAEDISFYDDDKYLACSKGACFCCYHYICDHPGHFVRPASHSKLWLNWGVPVLSDWSAQKIQRDTLILVNKKAKAKAIDRILSQSGARKSHPDSTTGLTMTARGVPWFHRRQTDSSYREHDTSSIQSGIGGSGTVFEAQAEGILSDQESSESEESGGPDLEDGSVSLVAAQMDLVAAQIAGLEF